MVSGYVAWKTVLSAEAQVARALKNAASAAERVDAEGFLSHFASDYEDYLHPSRSLLEQRVRESFSRVDRMNVTVQAVRVDVTGEEAVARFELVIVVFRGEERFVAFGTPFQPERVAATLQRGAEGWRFVRAVRDVPPG